MIIINKNKLNVILKKSAYSTKLNKETFKIGDEFKIIIEGKIKAKIMNNKTPKWFKIWNEKEFLPLKQDVKKLQKNVIEIKKDLFAIKNTPTMKKELVILK